MKNKMIKLLFLFMLTGAMLVGCGGSKAGTETGANNGSSTSTNTDANVSTEVNVDTEVEKNSDDNTVKIDSNIEYTETVIAFLIANEADYDKSMVDGTEVPRPTEQGDEYKVVLKQSINIYDINKNIIGYLKPDIKIAFGYFTDEWSLVGSLDYTEVYYVSTPDILAVMEVVEYPEVGTIDETVSNDDNAAEMSDRAKAFFDEVRKGIAEVNANNAALKAEHPEYTYVEIVEADSPKDLELLGTLIPSLDYDEELSVNNIIANITACGYSQYYIEYIVEKESPDPKVGTYVEFKLYAK